MAKTFKNLPLPEVNATPERASERDFFDLTDIPSTANNSEVVSNVSNTGNSSSQNTIDNLSNTSNSSVIDNPHTEKTLNNIISSKLDNSRNSSNVGNPGNTDNTTPPKSLDKSAIPTGGDARQTFVLSRNHLERLRDHVHARRAGGDYDYSQKQAMQEALDLLFASTAPVAPRPDQAREREQQRRERVQQGRQARA